MTSLIKDSSKQELFRTNLSKRYIIERILAILAWGAISIAILVLAVLLIDILIDGLPSLNLDFLIYPLIKRNGQELKFLYWGLFGL